MIQSFLAFLKKCILSYRKAEDHETFKNFLLQIGSTLQSQCPYSFPLFNIMSRLITLCSKGPDQQESHVKSKLRRILTSVNEDNEVLQEDKFDFLLKDLSELERALEECCRSSTVHISKGEVILLYADSKLVELFIRTALEEQPCTILIVLKDEQRYPDLMQKFQNEEIFFVSLPSVFSIMSKVNKVFLDCHAVMSDGASICEAGSYNISIIAKEFAVPLFMLAPRYKFTPLYAFSQDTFNYFKKPQQYFKEAEGVEGIEIQVQKYNLIPNDHIILIITDSHEYSTNYVYRVFSEYYKDINYTYNFKDLN